MIKSTMQKIDVSDEVWIWVHQKYENSLIVGTFYSFETNNIYYLAITEDDQWYQQSNETYNLKCTNSNIKTTTTIFINIIIIHCSINIWKS